MKTILYMTLSANGLFNQTSETHPIPKEILADFGKLVVKAGNLINGRKTFDMLREGFSNSSFSDMERVVVSRKLQNAKGVYVAKSPQSALDYLKQKNFTTALIAGGAELDNAFLSADLIDEIYLNIAPTLMNNGICLTIPKDQETRLKLIDTTNVSEHVFQLHYSVIH